GATLTHLGASRKSQFGLSWVAAPRGRWWNGRSRSCVEGENVSPRFLCWIRRRRREILLARHQRFGVGDLLSSLSSRWFILVFWRRPLAAGECRRLSASKERFSKPLARSSRPYRISPARDQGSG